ncbi:MAG: dihydroorotase [Elusimicrobia bacterium]|nr:dihydroorotase [Elusimicrobiota bacterium]
MPGNLVIKGGLVVDPSQRLEEVRDVFVEGGKIAKKAPEGALVVDAAGCWVVPGLVDMHVHLREPGREADETIASGAAAAAAGGVTTVLAMPNTEPPLDNPSLLSLLRAKAAIDAKVNVLFAAAVSLGQRGAALTEIFRLREAGAAALSDDGRPVMDSGLMRRALEYSRDAGLLLIDHAEDLGLSAAAPMNEGPAAAAKGLRGAPWSAETIHVLRDVALCELTGAGVHIAHISAAQSVAAVRSAKKRGLPISAEAAPHHFALTDGDIEGFDADYKMNPPLRSKADREALLEGLADGTIDAIATDHAPHDGAKKAAGLALAPCGVIGLETSLGLALTLLVAKKVIDKKRLVELMSAGPARLLGLKGKGSLRPGCDGDVTIVDPKARWTVPGSFISKSRNSPFLGMNLKGRAKATIVAGEVVHAL